MTVLITISHENISLAETLKWSIEFAAEKFFHCKITTKENAIDGATGLLLADPTSFNKLCEQDKQPGCPVLLLTDVIDEFQFTEALYTGVDAIADVSQGPSAVLEKINNLRNNKPDETQVLLQKIIQSSRTKNNLLKQESGYGLTRKEKNILKLMREANHLKLIADLTNTSYETVRTHVKNIYKKIGVASASEAVIKAMKIDLT